MKSGRPSIKDEFTDLKVSRQRKWQLRKERDGKCRRCGNKSHGKLCGVCTEKNRLEMKSYNEYRVGDLLR